MSFLDRYSCFIFVNLNIKFGFIYALSFSILPCIKYVPIFSSFTSKLFDKNLYLDKQNLNLKFLLFYLGLKLKFISLKLSYPGKFNFALITEPEMK